MRPLGLLLLSGCTAAFHASSNEDALLSHQTGSEEHERARREESRQRMREAVQARNDREQAEREAERKRSEAQLAAYNSMRATEERISSWLTRAPVQCGLELNHRACSAGPEEASPEQRASCAAACKASVLAALEKRLEAAVEACVAAAVSAQCTGSLPPDLDVNGPGGKQVSPDATKAYRDICSKQCSEKRAQAAKLAKEAPRAEREGTRLVEQYKRCMMAVDSTLDARKEELYDRDLYEARMTKANEKCRSQHRCDWLEEFSEFECVYGN
jgi:hypothetical protein